MTCQRFRRRLAAAAAKVALDTLPGATACVAVAVATGFAVADAAEHYMKKAKEGVVVLDKSDAAVHVPGEALDDEDLVTEPENAVVVVVVATVIGPEDEVAVDEYRVIVNLVVVVPCA